MVLVMVKIMLVVIKKGGGDGGGGLSLDYGHVEEAV